MNYKIYIGGSIFIIFILALSGCMDFFSFNNTITYESQPTAINYTITYGYKIKCTGQGKYSINYDLDNPEVLNGRILSTYIHNNNYQIINLATYNDVIRWDFNSSENTDYELLITAEIDAESHITSDLNQPDALTLEQINKQHPNLVEQFCSAQSNKTTVFIDPLNPAISEITDEILTNAKTNNSFLVAKELFKWLKQQTTYKTHELNDEAVQSAYNTLMLGTGDCDDLSFLYISLCRSLNIPSRYIRGFLLDESSLVQHAWAEVFVGGGIGNDGWIPVECAGTSNNIQTEIHQNFGIESAGHLRLFIDDGSNESLNITFSGINYRIFSDNRVIDIKFYSSVNNYLIIKSQQLFIEDNRIRYYK